MSHLASDICKACAASDDQLNSHTNYDVDNDDETSAKQSYDQTSTILPPSTNSDIEMECAPISADIKLREAELASKQKELRQLEQKLKKKEDELKLKDVKLKEYEKSGMKYEQKIEALEYRNRELENTIKTLRDHTTMNVSKPTPINVPPQQNMPEAQITSKTNSARSNTGPFDHLIKGIHDRVSAYVLLKVEKQIENLIDIDTNLCSPEINETQQPTTYRFDHVDEHNSSVNCPSNITSSPELIAGHLPNNQPLPNVYENTTNHPTNLNTPWSNQPPPGSKVNSSTVPLNQQNYTDYRNLNDTADQNTSQSRTTFEHYNQNYGMNTSHLSQSHPTYTYGQPLYYQHQNNEPSQSTEMKKRFLRRGNLINLIR